MFFRSLEAQQADTDLRSPLEDLSSNHRLCVSVGHWKQLRLPWLLVVIRLPWLYSAVLHSLIRTNGPGVWYCGGSVHTVSTVCGCLRLCLCESSSGVERERRVSRGGDEEEMRWRERRKRWWSLQEREKDREVANRQGGRHRETIKIVLTLKKKTHTHTNSEEMKLLPHSVQIQ